MRIEKIALKNLVSPDYNPREISDKEMEKLKQSIKDFGYVDPIIVNDVDNNILGGNQRFEAMKQLGIKEAEVSFVHITDPNKAKALNLRLNKLSGEWDNVKLNNILQELELNHFDITITGFDNIDLQEIKLENELEFDYDIDQFNKEIPEETIEEETIEEETENIIICPHCGEKIEL